jgi:CheY-like chemotaxis protein
MIGKGKPMKKPASILLVEDNAMDVELILDAFKEARFDNKIQIAGNGKEALQYMFGEGAYADRQQYPLPDIVLLDLNMPGVDGHEVLKKIKSTEKLKRLPVIILTSSKDEGDRAMSYDNGANSYLVKPVSFDDFLKVVKQVSEYWLTLNIKPPLE